MQKDQTRSSISSVVSDFVAQLEALVRQAAVEQVMSALGGLGAPTLARREPGRPRGTARKPGRPAKRGRRATGDVDAMGEKLLAHVKANPGQRGEQIAAAMRSDVGTIRLPMKKLIAAKKVTTKGERRGMMYFPVGEGAGPSRPAKTKNGRRGTRKAKRAAKASRGGRKGKHSARKTKRAQVVRRKPATKSRAVAASRKTKAKPAAARSAVVEAAA